MAKRILVIDDDPDIRELIATQLGSLGYEVRTAHDGVEGLDACHAQKPDLMIVDVMMPGLDGFQFVDFVTKNPYTVDIPCVFLTAKDQLPDKVKGLQMGAYDYMTKPFSMGELVARIEGILARHAQQAARVADDTLVAGRLDDMHLSDIVQTVEQTDLTGVLRMTHARAAVEIWFNEGRIVAAKADGAEGEDALYEALKWRKGEFRFEKCEPPTTEGLGENNLALMMRAYQRLDEDADKAGSDDPS
ncbi:MAG: response regulator [Armatimonadota bacterium]